MKKRILLLGSLLVLMGIVFYYRDQFSLMQLQHVIKHCGIWAPILFIVLYTLATVLFLPGLLFTLLGGLLFGPYLGTLYSLTGATLGASVAFLIARFMLSDWIRQKTGQNRLNRLMQGIQQSGWRFVAVVRSMPIIPFNLLNYALGLTPITLPSYIIPTFIFMSPGAFAYSYVGSLGPDLIQGDLRQQLGKLSIALSLLMLLAAMPWLYKCLFSSKK